MNHDAPASSSLANRIAGQYMAGVVFVALLLFLPAGTVAFWEGWAYIGTLFLPMLGVLAYLLRHDRDLIRRRIEARERERRQAAVIGAAAVYFLLLFLLCGLDERYGWSHVPVPVVIVADVLILLGYGLFFLVLRENTYAARTVRVEAGQEVIATGPYALVRHPMYLAYALMFVLTPLALGSYWGLLLSVWIVPVLVVRIRGEEETLLRELPGYGEYVRRTRYRLFPGVW